MRRARVKVEGRAYYHVMSRCALQQFLLTDDDVKGMFLKILRRAEAFSGVNVVNYCIMDNHFHLLVKVPERQNVTDAKLDRRIEILYGAKKKSMIFARWDKLRKIHRDDVVEKERNAMRKRMYDISEFMKTFKQRFSLWYCSNHGNIEGTIWQGPFHSVLVQGSHDALRTISAYITLNPVRANIVERPEDYPWCGYGAASAGDRNAKRALLSTNANDGRVDAKWAAYAEMMATVAAEDENDRSGRMEPAKAKGLNNDEGTNTGDALLTKTKELSRGVAFGSKSFVMEAIARASNTDEILTVAKAYCQGDGRSSLFCAGRRSA